MTDNTTTAKNRRLVRGYQRLKRSPDTGLKGEVKMSMGWLRLTPCARYKQMNQKMRVEYMYKLKKLKYNANEGEYEPQQLTDEGSGDQTDQVQ